MIKELTPAKLMSWENPFPLPIRYKNWQVIFAFFTSRNFCCDFDGWFRTVCEVAFLMIFKHCVVLKLWNWFFLTPEPDSWKRGVSAKDRKGGKCQSFFLLICQESTFPNTRSGQLGSSSYKVTIVLTKRKLWSSSILDWGHGSAGCSSHATRRPDCDPKRPGCHSPLLWPWQS